ncbi:hypothetical protein BDD21_0647 [Thiocapsa rosea]|uniref:Uncharacterized protein n=1 Tax=Thiocapsa rosea TaxID=69360 RepID=A0A495V1J2_9GAMM|nr:hypothetical protein BDD21_0647 [Thiocapsa rosea]
MRTVMTNDDKPQNGRAEKCSRCRQRGPQRDLRLGRSARISIKPRPARYAMFRMGSAKAGMAAVGADAL